MGSRSGKRLTNEQRKENRRRRLREKQKRPRPTHRPIRTGYSEIHQALKQYILAYVNSYHSKPSYKTLTAGASLRSINIREPVVGQDLILDIRSITYEDDWCSVDIAIHTEKRRYGENLNRW